MEFLWISGLFCIQLTFLGLPIHFFDLFWGFVGVILGIWVGMSFFSNFEPQMPLQKSKKPLFFYIEHACCSAILSPRTVLGKWCHHRSSMYVQSITTKIEPSMLILVLLNPGIWTTQLDPRLQLLSGGEAISGQRHLDPTNTTRTLKGRLPPSQRSSLRAHHIKSTVYGFKMI